MAFQRSSGSSGYDDVFGRRSSGFNTVRGPNPPSGATSDINMAIGNATPRKASQHFARGNAGAIARAISPDRFNPPGQRRGKMPKNKQLHGADNSPRGSKSAPNSNESRAFPSGSQANQSQV